MNSSFVLDRSRGKLLGVCAGIANRFGIDALLVRIGFIASVLLGFGLAIPLYFIIALLAD